MNRDPDVLLVTPWNRQGGLATYSQYLAEQFDQDVDIFPWDERSIGRRLLGTPFIGKSALRRLRSVEVVHVQYSFGDYVFALPVLLAIAKLVGAQVVITQHERFETLPLASVVNLYHQLLYFLVDAIVVHTPFRKERIWRVHHDRVEVVPHGVIHRSDHDRTPRQARQLLLPGFVHPRKGHDLALQALAELPPAFTLTVVGGTASDEYLASLRNLAVELGVEDRVSWEPEFVPEGQLFDEFQNSDLVVLPYRRHAAMSGILSHCISWRVPSVVSQAPTLTSAIPCEEVFFSPRTPDALAEQIRRVADDEAVQREIISTLNALGWEWSWERVADRTAHIYMEVVR
jgi:glycosyltransferase involved in cell wall biosynthesis